MNNRVVIRWLCAFVGTRLPFRTQLLHELSSKAARTLRAAEWVAPDAKPVRQFLGGDQVYLRAYGNVVEWVDHSPLGQGVTWYCAWYPRYLSLVPDNVVALPLSCMWGFYSHTGTQCDGIIKSTPPRDLVYQAADYSRARLRGESPSKRPLELYGTAYDTDDSGVRVIRYNAATGAVMYDLEVWASSVEPMASYGLERGSSYLETEPDFVENPYSGFRVHGRFGVGILFDNKNVEKYWPRDVYSGPVPGRRAGWELESCDPDHDSVHSEAWVRGAAVGVVISDYCWRPEDADVYQKTAIGVARMKGLPIYRWQKALRRLTRVE